MTEDQKKRFSEALKRLAGDEDMLGTLAMIAAEDAPAMVRTMNEDLQNGRLECYAKSAHSLKGLLSTFETNEPVSEIQLSIDAARDGDEATAKSSHEAIQPSIVALVQEIRDLAL